jgi:hypothetical protein
MSPQLLRIGISKTIRFDDKKPSVMLQFMLETNQPTAIITTLIQGKVTLILSYTEEKHEGFLIQQNTDPIHLEGDQLQTDKNYYLFIESTST